MNRLIVQTLGVAAFFSVFVYLLKSDPQPYSTVAESAADVSVQRPAAPEVVPPLPGSSGSPHQSVNFQSVQERFGVSFDPMLVMALGEFTDEEIQAYDALHVLPFNRALGSDCYELSDPQLPLQTFETCRTVRERPEHPYNDLADADLRDLAVHDAVAALLLGRRSGSEAQRLQWHLRAAALAEKSGPLMALAQRRYGSPFELKRVGSQLQRVPRRDVMVTRLALELVARRLGDPRANPDRWRSLLLRDADLETQDAISKADDMARRFMDQMAEAQRQITGSVQMRELIDA